MATSVKRKGAGSSGKQADLPVGAEHRSTRAAAKKAKCLTDAAVEHSQQQNKKDSIKGSRRSSPDNKPQNVAKMPGGDRQAHKSKNTQETQPAKRSYGGSACESLPTEVLKAIFSNLEPEDVYKLRGVCTAFKAACAQLPSPFQLTMPVQLGGGRVIIPALQNAWEERLNGIKQAQFAPSKLKLSMRTTGSDPVPEATSHAEIEGQPAVHRIVQRLQAMLGQLGSLRSLSELKEVELNLPLHRSVLTAVSDVMPKVTSLKLNNLLALPHNHMMALTSFPRPFPHVTQLDVRLRCWDQLQQLSNLPQLTDLTLRHAMWNIPELNGLMALTKLTSLDFQAEDFRALLQLDCLGNARYLPRLRHMRVGMALARPESSVAYLASCTALERLDLDLRVPDDAQATVRGHLLELGMLRRQTVVNITLRANAFDSMRYYTRGMACDQHPDNFKFSSIPRGLVDDAWSLLASIKGPLTFHLKGYQCPLKGLPNLSESKLTRLHVSNCYLSVSDVKSLAAIKSLKHLTLAFMPRLPEKPEKAPVFLASQPLTVPQPDTRALEISDFAQLVKELVVLEVFEIKEVLAYCMYAPQVPIYKALVAAYAEKQQKELHGGGVPVQQQAAAAPAPVPAAAAAAAPQPRVPCSPDTCASTSAAKVEPTAAGAHDVAASAPPAPPLAVAALRRCSMHTRNSAVTADTVAEDAGTDKAGQPSKRAAKATAAQSQLSAVHASVPALTPAAGLTAPNYPAGSTAEQLLMDEEQMLDAGDWCTQGGDKQLSSLLMACSALQCMSIELWSPDLTGRMRYTRTALNLMGRDHAYWELFVPGMAKVYGKRPSGLADMPE